MTGSHSVKARLERAPALHQCPQCPFKDMTKAKLNRHKVGCDKRFRPKKNQEKPLRHEQEESNATASEENIVPVPDGPHMTVEYTDPQILDDVNNLLIHHVKRQTSIHKEDKHKIKVLLKHFLMDLFKHPRQDLSEDEREDEEESEKDENDQDANKDNQVNGAPGKTRSTRKKNKDDKKDEKKPSKKELLNEADVKVEPSKDGRKTPLHARDMEPVSFTSK